MPIDDRRTDDISYETLWLRELMAYQPQSRILQNWEIEAYLDQGTFSRIYKAVQPETGLRSVIKFIPNPMELNQCSAPNSQEDLFYRSRFAASKREAEIMSRFQDDKYIIHYLEAPEFLERIFQNQRGQTVCQHAVLICMPLYKNHKEWLPLVLDSQSGRLRLGMEMAQALMSFEEKGVFHRDIKPGNILMDNDYHFYLSDVGEAKLESEFTTMGFHGTRPYMAPEVYELETKQQKMRSDHRSDIYSLGIILYKLYNRNQFPFLTNEGTLSEEATTSYKTYQQKNNIEDNEFLTASERARLLRYNGFELPPPCDANPQLAQVILRACAYRRENRYQKAADLFAALQCCAKGEPLPQALQFKTGKASKKAAGFKRYMPIVCAVLAIALAFSLGVRNGQNSGGGVSTGANDAPTATVMATATPVATATPTRVPTTTPAPTATPTRVPTATPALTATPTAKPTATPQATKTPEEILAGKPMDTINTGDYKLDVYENNLAVIVDYTGNDTILNIPSKIDGYRVVSIGDNAFEYCSFLTSITIPDGVTSIGNSAFRDCHSLTAINIPDSVTSIGDSAFFFCISLTNINIPDGITTIGEQVFWYCNSLTSINIPDGVTSIGNSAFRDCRSLTAINIPDSVTSIGDYAFSDCDSLNNIIIPDGIVSIGKQVFYGCNFLTTIIIPDSVTSIGTSAFSYCTALTSVTIPDSVTFIGAFAFSHCQSLTSIIVPESVTSIENNTFFRCASLTLTVTPGSYAETYASENGIEYQLAKATPKTDSSYNPTFASIKKGDQIQFGHYEQDGNLKNGEEPIVWIVLNVEEDSITLMSLYALGDYAYDNSGKAGITWQTSEIRHMLNEEFYQTAFTPEEQAQILTTDLETVQENQHSYVNSTDKVYLLSIDEVRDMSLELRICNYPPYDERSESLFWWLRNGMLANCVGSFASFRSEYETDWYANLNGLRPVIRIALNQSGNNSFD